jgi:hypothetical protein
MKTISELNSQYIEIAREIASVFGQMKNLGDEKYTEEYTFAFTNSILNLVNSCVEYKLTGWKEGSLPQTSSKFTEAVICNIDTNDKDITLVTYDRWNKVWRNANSLRKIQKSKYTHYLPIVKPDYKIMGIGELTPKEDDEHSKI